MIRGALIAAVVLVAILCTPAMLRPEFNSADIICILAPFAVAAIALAPRLPLGWLVQHIPEDHPDALGTLDLAERAHRKASDQ